MSVGHCHHFLDEDGEFVSQQHWHDLGSYGNQVHHQHLGWEGKFFHSHPGRRCEIASDTNDLVTELVQVAAVALAAAHDISGFRFSDLVAQVSEEMARQHAKWGDQSHTPDRWSVILTEEVGEVARASLEATYWESDAEMWRSFQ